MVLAKGYNAKAKNIAKKMGNNTTARLYITYETAAATLNLKIVLFLIIGQYLNMIIEEMDFFYAPILQ